MFFRRKRRNKRDSVRVEVSNNQNLPNDVRERRDKINRGSLVGRIWRSMRLKRRIPLPDVRQPEVFKQPRQRCSDTNSPASLGNRDTNVRQQDSPLENMLCSRMKSYNILPEVNNSSVVANNASSTSGGEVTACCSREINATNNRNLESHLSSSNAERRRSASADRNRYRENREHQRLAHTHSNNERPRSHDYEFQNQNIRQLAIQINNQNRPVSDSRILERYFQPSENRSRALAPIESTNCLRISEENAAASRHMNSSDIPQRDRETHRYNRFNNESRESRARNNRGNNLVQRNRCEVARREENDFNTESNEIIYDRLRELHITPELNCERRNECSVFRERRGVNTRAPVERLILRENVMRESRIPTENWRDYRFAQTNEINWGNNVNISNGIELPREYRPVTELCHESQDISSSYNSSIRDAEVFYTENLRPDPPPYDEAINREYTTTLRSRPPSYSHVVEEIINERLTMGTRLYTRHYPDAEPRYNPFLAVRS